MAWLYVLGAGIVEILWVLGLKYSTSYLAWAGTILLIVISFYLIMKAANYLPVGSVYAVFTGIGTFGITLVDVILFSTPISTIKILFLCLIVAGVIGVKLTTKESDVTEEGVDE